MQVLALQGSPRKGGNTDILLDIVLAELRSRGASVKKQYLGPMNVRGCNECFACQGVLKEPGCPIKDDMRGIYRDLLKADLMIFATPVFCWGASAQLKAVLDRCYALFKFRRDPYVCLMAGKSAALVVTAAGGREDGVDLVEASYRRLIEYARADNAGVLAACSLQSPEATAQDTKLAARAKRFGQRLAKALSL